MALRASYSRSRASVLFFLLVLGYALLSARLFEIQVLQRSFYRQKADKYHVRELRLPGHRGTILDRNGGMLAINADVGSISIDPSHYWDPEKFPFEKINGKKVRQAPDKDKAARRISDALGIPYDVVRPKLDRQKRFVWIARHVSLEKVRRADAAGIPGLQIDDELKRVYPMGGLAAHVLGHTDVDGKGVSGIEMRFDRALARRDGLAKLEVDRKGHIIPGTLRSFREPRDGADITLTIDSRIQQVAERELANQCRKYHAAGGTVTVIDPKTGDVLALVNYPGFDPNRMAESPDSHWRNRAVTDLYEPGSTMKGVTAAAALDAGVVNLTQRFNCPGYLRIGQRVVHDVYEGPGSFGSLDLSGIIRFSSNVGMSQVGLKLGATRLEKYLEQFGLLDPSGLGLPGEIPSWMKKTNWDNHFTATVAFGQSVNFSALRLANAYAAIANGGVLMRPRIVQSIRWPHDGPMRGAVEEIPPVAIRRVVSRQSANMVTNLLKGVVTDGTGKTAKVAGYNVVGKTGSAQKAFPGKGYVPGKYIASFVGYLPADNPRVVILVTVDEPQGTHWGAVAAAPVFREVARQAMWFLQVPPDDPDDTMDGARPSTWRRAKRR